MKCETVGAIASLSLVAFLSAPGCAARSSEVNVRLQETVTDLRSEIDDLKRAAEASYDREQAVAERLRQVEESAALLHAQMATQRGMLDTLRGGGHRPKAPSRRGSFDVAAAYRDASHSYADHDYEKALAQFGELLVRASSSRYADNAQYWIGECYYGMGEFRRALTEFAKVFAYEQTEKSDDAQLQIARSHRALGERTEALAAYQKLLDEYPTSEYYEPAGVEINYLRGP